MKRRDFLKTGAVVSASAALSMRFDGLQAVLASNPLSVKEVPDLVAVMGGEPAAMLDKALETLGGIGNFVKRGQKIVIKPNIGWDRAPELAANTNPQLVGALVKKCIDAGASSVTVFDHTCDRDWQKCYSNSGIEGAVKAAGGVMAPGNDESYYKELAIPKGIRLKSAKIHNTLIEADAWINVPVLKQHGGGADLTSAMKNLMGIVWDRRYFHSNNLHQTIADICTWEKKPVLNIVDAYRIMFRNGPQGRAESDSVIVKALIASTDIVAIDVAALQFFNQVEKLDLEKVSHIGFGQAHKLGTTDLTKLKIERIRL